MPDEPLRFSLTGGPLPDGLTIGPMQSINLRPRTWAEYELALEAIERGIFPEAMFDLSDFDD